ncbi:branched-chain amino acid transport system II carrier protein [Clostridioides mangenotii]|uniref:branched-chain amino acid transport system II carrier protein n=1 Tax=Metaclostridioides mangenotii TaxID=1540 RepID=UPI002149A795|nr:branched-chain amino acid transport system II carrier protein [Clostridioides mangenotii]MCR1953736.1 branched-chain amino acid transport system II carrier protein [Clostridioides mangenotii]
MGGKQVKDMMVVGFALFAMFFGAGNLIFPPYLGVLTGPQWWISFSGFVFADVGLALLAVIALIKYNGNAEQMLSRCGKKLGIIMGTAIVICIGPLVAIPRTAASTYEIGILPTIGPGLNPIVFSIIFFAITLVLAIRPSKVVDIVGQYLTPALLIALAVLIIKGVLTPLGDIRPDSLIDATFAEGITQGYQTMDALGAIIFSSVIILSVIDKGYTEEKQKFKMTLGSGIVAAVGLFLVYGGLAYLGATVSKQYGADIAQTDLVVKITAALLGNGGKMLLGLVVALACLTTAIGLASAAGQYFDDLTKGKLKYEYVVIFICVFSAVVSNFGVSTIIKLASPILSLVYPAAVTMIILSLFTEKIKNDNVFKFATYMALLISVLTLIKVPIVDSLPFAPLGFNWVVPVIIAGIIGHFVPDKSEKTVVSSVRS